MTCFYGVYQTPPHVGHVLCKQCGLPPHPNFRLTISSLSPTDIIRQEHSMHKHKAEEMYTCLLIKQTFSCTGNVAVSEACKNSTSLWRTQPDAYSCTQTFYYSAPSPSHMQAGQLHMWLRLLYYRSQLASQQGWPMNEQCTWPADWNLMKCKFLDSLFTQTPIQHR